MTKKSKTTRPARTTLAETLKVNQKNAGHDETIYGNFAEYKEVIDGHNSQAIPRGEKERE